MVNDGVVDVDIGCILEVVKWFLNFVMVLMLNCQLEVVVYGVRLDFVICICSVIKGMRVGIVCGVFIFDKYIQGMNFVVV